MGNAPPFVTPDKTGLVNPDGSSDVSEEVRGNDQKVFLTIMFGTMNISYG